MQPTMQMDRLKGGLAGLVRSLFPSLDFLALYPGTIVQQRGANTFDVQPDDARIPGLSGIPIKLPFPGFGLTLDAGATPRCLIGWAGGSPAAPFCALWEAPGIQALTITAEQSVGIQAPAVNLGDAAAAVGRVGDQVQVTFTAAEFAAMVPTCAVAPGPVVATSSVTLTGTITAGSNKVKA